MYHVISNAQAKASIDAEQQFAALRDAESQYARARGSWHWKTISGKDYLYSKEGKSSRSHGPRSPETEQMLLQHVTRRAQLEERVRDLRERVREATGINRVYRVGHVANEVADLCIQLDKAGLLDKDITIIGTNAMHAYEALATVRFDELAPDRRAVRHRGAGKRTLLLAANAFVAKNAFIELLRKSDRSYSFECDEPFRAVSARSGCTVDLLANWPNSDWTDEPDAFFKREDKAGTNIWDLSWMLRAPRMMQTVIALDGRPFRLTAPDPRAFAMFKLWLGTDCPDREPVKRKCDLDQALALVQILEDRLPHLQRSWPQFELVLKRLAQRKA